jgi:hypothetical protein
VDEGFGTEEVDQDGDGFPENDDCDDDDAAVNPAAEEICDDGVDQDCDGVDCSDETTDPTTPTSPTEPDDEDEVDEKNGGCRGSGGTYSAIFLLAPLGFFRRRR